MKRSALILAAAAIAIASPLPARSQEPALVQPEGPPGPAAGTTSIQGRAAPAPEAVEIPPMTPGEPMTLAQALDLASRRNLSLDVAALEVTKAEAQLKQAWALVLPGIQGKVTVMQRDHEDAADFAGTSIVMYPQQEMKGYLEAGMPLVNAQSWFTIAAAKKGIEAQRLLSEDERRKLLFEVANLYLNGLTARSAIGMYEEMLKASARHLDVARARQEAGAGLKIDVLRAQTEMEQARQELIRFHLLFDNARDAVGMLTGVGGLPMLVDVEGFTAPVEGDEALAAQAVANLPAIKAMRVAIEAMEKQLDASWMQFLPTLDVGWQLSYQFSELAALGSADRSRWALVFTLTVPIYNHFRYGDLDYKRAALRQAMLREEDVADKLSTGVRAARRSYLAALSTAVTARRQVELAEEALKLIEASYEAGTGTSLDVTDAWRTLSQARANDIMKSLEAQISLLALFETIGEDVPAGR